MNELPKTHIDIINQLYSDIEVIFSSVGALTPPTNELYEFSSWRYCTPIERKNKGKIGYICSYIYSGQMPRVRIVVHSFAQGGQSITFDGAAFIKDLYEKQRYKSTKEIKVDVKLKNASDVLARKKREQLEIQRKHQQFLKHLNNWKEGNSYVGNHPYIIKKNVFNNVF